MEIFVLKTNIKREDLSRIKQTLDTLPSIKKWTIDFEDCDHVLRIESTSENILAIVISEVEALGLVCMDLEY
jgi:hypothetical protein